MGDLTRDSIIDGINVRASGHVEVRRVDRVLDGDTVISETPNRFVVSPTDRLDDPDNPLPPQVVTIAMAARTPEQVQAWTDAFVAQQEQARQHQQDAAAKTLAAQQALVDVRDKMVIAANALNDVMQAIQTLTAAVSA